MSNQVYEYTNTRKSERNFGNYSTNQNIRLTVTRNHGSIPCSYLVHVFFINNPKRTDIYPYQSFGPSPSL